MYDINHIGMRFEDNYFYVDAKVSDMEIVAWLITYEGKGGYGLGGHGVYFENSQDAMMFALKWGGNV